MKTIKIWLIDLKSKIRSAQIKAAIAVNSALIEFYWDLGQMIAEKENILGNKLIEQVAKDLQTEFPEMKGLSRTNLSYAKQFYQFYKPSIDQQVVGIFGQAVDQFSKQPNALIPWDTIFLYSVNKKIQ